MDYRLHGIPHATTEDNTYGGYFVPEGAIVIVNIRYILHNLAVYLET